MRILQEVDGGKPVIEICRAYGGRSRASRVILLVSIQIALRVGVARVFLKATAGTDFRSAGVIPVHPYWPACSFRLPWLPAQSTPGHAGRVFTPARGGHKNANRHTRRLV